MPNLLTTSIKRQLLIDRLDVIKSTLDAIPKEHIFVFGRQLGKTTMHKRWMELVRETQDISHVLEKDARKSSDLFGQYKAYLSRHLNERQMSAINNELSQMVREV